MHVISVINYKGGVGKTTITANLGAELARRGRRVLLIDIDPQASLTFSFLPPEEWVRNYAESKTLRNWFKSFENNQLISLRDIIFTPRKAAKKLKELGSEGQLDLISSHLDLINIDLELATKLGGGISVKDFSKNFLKIYGALSKAIHQLDSKEYDFVLIDCPHNFNITTRTAVVASSHLLIPAIPDYLSTMGIHYLKKRCDELIFDYNEYIRFGGENNLVEISPKRLGIIFNMIQIHSGKPIAILLEYMEKQRRLKYPVFESYLRSKIIFSDAPLYGVPVILAYYNLKQYKDVIQDIHNFVSEFENKVGVSEIVSSNN